MNIKKYISWQLREWLPLILLSAILCLGITFFWADNLITVPPINGEGGYVDGVNTYQPFTILEATIIIGMILSTIAPIFVYQYRYSKQKIDFYSSLPCSEKTVRRVRMIMALCVILIITTLCFLFGFIIQINKQIQGNQVRVQQGLEEYWFDYPLYIVCFLFILLYMCFNYFIHLFFVSRANNSVDAVILLFEGLLITCLLAYGFVLEIVHLFHLKHFNMVDYFSVGPSTPIVLLISYFEKLILKRTEYSSISTTNIISLVVIGVLGIVAFFYDWFWKEPNGDLAGTHGPKKIPEYVILHLGMFALSQYLISLSIFGYLLWVLYAGTYFIIMLIYNRGPKVNKAMWIPAVCISLIQAVLMVIHNSLNGF